MVNFNSISFEEEKSKAWRLREAEDILDRIMAGSSESESLEKLLDAEKLVICSYVLGGILSSSRVRLKTAQIRRFYEAILGLRTTMTSWTRHNQGITDETKYFQQVVKTPLMMLKPQLANAQARQPREFTPLFTVLNPCIDRVNSPEGLRRLAQFMEAIVAYHKFHGGRD